MVIRNVPTQRLSVPTSRVSGRPLTDTKAMKTDLLLKTAQAIQGIGNEISNRYSESQYDEFITQFEQDSALMFEENTKDLNKYGEFSDLTNKGFDSLEKNILKKSKNLNPSYTKKLKKYLLSKRTENVTRSISAASTAERAIIPSKIKNKLNNLLISSRGMNVNSPFIAENLNNFIDYVKSQKGVIGDAAVELNIISAKASLEEAYVDKVIADPEGNYGQFIPELSSPERAPREGTSTYEFKYATQERINVLQGRARRRLDADKTAKQKAIEDIQDANEITIDESLKKTSQSLSNISSMISEVGDMQGLNNVGTNIKELSAKVSQFNTLIQDTNLNEKDRKNLTTDFSKLISQLEGTKRVYKLIAGLIERKKIALKEIELGIRDSFPKDFGKPEKQILMDLASEYNESNPEFSASLLKSANKFDQMYKNIESSLTAVKEKKTAEKTPYLVKDEKQKKIVNNTIVKTVIKNSKLINTDLRKIAPEFNQNDEPLLNIMENPFHKDFDTSQAIFVKFNQFPEAALSKLKFNIENVDPTDTDSKNLALQSLFKIKQIASTFGITVSNGEYFKSERVKDALTDFNNLGIEKYPEDQLSQAATLIFPNRGNVTILEQANIKLPMLRDVESRPISSSYKDGRGANIKTNKDFIKKELIDHFSSFNPLGLFGDTPTFTDADINIFYQAVKGEMTRLINQPSFQIEYYNTFGNIWKSPLLQKAVSNTLPKVAYNKEDGSLQYGGIYTPASKQLHHPEVVKNNLATQFNNNVNISSEVKKELFRKGVLVETKLPSKNKAVKTPAGYEIFSNTYYPSDDVPIEGNYHNKLTLNQHERTIGFKRNTENTAITFGKDIKLIKVGEIKLIEDTGINGLTFEEFLINVDSRNKSTTYSESLDNVDFLQSQYDVWSKNKIKKRTSIVPEYQAVDKNGLPVKNIPRLSMKRSQTNKSEALYNAMQKEVQKRFLRAISIGMTASESTVKSDWFEQNLQNAGNSKPFFSIPIPDSMTFAEKIKADAEQSEMESFINEL